jgi:AbrB family looped-hinge helix DNA binding protein
MKVSKVTSKGQITIPVEIRSALAIDESSHVEVTRVGEEIRLRKVLSVRPLSEGDPIWRLVGVGASGDTDVSENHDRYLADGEVRRWRESS